MEPERLPLGKAFDVPFLSLDQTSVEMGSILFLFLLVAIIARVESRRQLVRRLVQAGSAVVFFYVVYSCLGVFGMVRNGLFGLTLLGSAYTEAFYWLALPVVIVSITLLRGSLFCGWICPTGSLQDLATAVGDLVRRGPVRRTPGRLALLGLSLAGFLALVAWQGRERALFVEDSSLHWGGALLLVTFLVVARAADDLPTRALRALSLGAIVVTAVSRISITSPVHFAFTSRGDPASALTTLVLMVAALFVGRAWCRYVCPWGYLMGLLQRFSRLRIVRVASRCNDCGECVPECAVGAIDAGGVRAEDCQFCYACVDVCPRGACEVVDAWQGEPQRPALGSGGLAPRAR
jgi:polyferredoxin